MNHGKTFFSRLSLLLIILFLNACGPSKEKIEATASQVAAAMFATQTALAPTATATNTLTPTASPTPTPTPTPTLLPTIAPPPAPSAGNANIYGRVLWQGKPCAGVVLTLSGLPNDISGFMLEIVTSDENGLFLFANIPPPKSDYTFGMWTEKTDFLAGKANAPDIDVSVEPNENYNIGEYYLLSTDLVLLSPERGSTISDSNPSLIWEPYPGASYYHLELEQLLGNYTNMELDIEETQIDIDLPLMACTYGWDITAYSETGIPLAKTDAEFVDDPLAFYERFDGLFTIENDALPSCFINLIYPPDYATLSVAEGNAGFLWEAHPLATSYRIFGNRTHDASGNISIRRNVIFETIEIMEDGSFTTTDLPQLARGQYNWRVIAYFDGAIIAGSSTWDFTIR